MEKMGIDTKHLFDIMKVGSHGSGHFRAYGKNCVEKDYPLGFALELALKDLVYMKRLYEKYNVPGFVLDGAMDLLRLAVKEGRGKHDVTEISAVMYEYLGLDTGEKN
jgi:3-hydroxyisobutyrate dehydrogenase-like beta-hydroxyacid dehydrogenase